MKVFTCMGFGKQTPIYGVIMAVIVAQDEEQARQILKTKLEPQGLDDCCLDGKPCVITEVKTDSPNCLIFDHDDILEPPQPDNVV